MNYSLQYPLDSLYYRTPAKPHLCGPYRYSSNYNGCTFEQVAKTEAPSRTDFKFSKKESYVDSQLSAVAPPKFNDNEFIKQILAQPMAFDLSPLTPTDKLAFITRNIHNKQLMDKLLSLKIVKPETKNVIGLIPDLTKESKEKENKPKTQVKKEKFFENFSILGLF